MTRVGIDYGSVSSGLVQVFSNVARQVTDAGYGYFAVMPRSELEIVSPSKVRLSLPIAEKTEVDISEVSKDFILSSVGVRLQKTEGQNLDTEQFQIKFAAFKTPEERDAFMDQVKGMEFFNQEKIHVLPFEPEVNSLDIGWQMVSMSSAHYNPKAFS